MATVTGLTKDRMVEMENATVIDGDVIGDNLMLTTRGGTQINAGNVRGPQGTNGTQGPPGPVNSVNDQLAAVYAPRIFNARADIDAWSNPPNGAQAYTLTEKKSWVRLSGVWTWNGPQGQLGYTQTTSPSGDFTSYTTLLSVGPIVLPASRRLRLQSHCFGWMSSLQTDICRFQIKEGAVSLGTSDSLAHTAAGAASSFNDVTAYITAVTGSHTYSWGASYLYGGTGRVNADPIGPMFLMVEDLGPG